VLSIHGLRFSALRMKKTFPLAVLLTVLLFGAASCSLLTPYKPTPEVKIAVIRVADEYLRSIVQGKTAHLSDMILWGEYAPKKKLTRDAVTAEMESIKGKYPLDQHPLLGLELRNLDIGEDIAELTLKKASMPEMPEITIELVWVGNGWLITNDNLFGQDGIIPSLAKSASK
jgi:hypothetical protein